MTDAHTNRIEAVAQPDATNLFPILQGGRFSCAHFRTVRVAHLLPSSNLGGAEIAISRLTCGLAKEGTESIVFSPPDAVRVRSLFASHVSRFEDWRQPGPWVSESGHFLAEAFSLARTLRQSHVDLVHCSKPASALSVGGVAARLASKPVVTHVHSPVGPLPFRLRQLLKVVDHYVFVSKASKHESDLKVAEDQYSIVYCGLDAGQVAGGVVGTPNLRDQFGIASDARIVTMVSRISPQKDFATLAEAFAQVVRSEPRAHLLLVGSGDERYAETVRELFRRKSLTDHVTFAGFRDDAVGIMNQSDLVVLATHFEGVPLVIMEAMALEKPIVATAVGGIPEAIHDGVSGLLVPPGNAEALSDAIVSYLDDPELAAATGRMAKRAYEKRFTLDQFVDGVESVYENVLAAH